MLLAAGLGIILTLPARAADPFADNPFPVPYKQAPADPALRWAGFQSRVGTFLPTDPYHWWRFDVTNRAEMQDVYWREEMVAGTVALGWSGSFATLEPGKTTQAWRNAVLRVVNLHRYIYGNGANYLREDPGQNPALQAGAMVEARNFVAWNYQLKHNLTAADMPPGFKYADLATNGAQSSLAIGMETPAGITVYLTDEGNPTAGHRAAFTIPDTDIAATGDVAAQDGTYPTYSYSNALRVAWSPGNGLTPYPLPVGDPFAQFFAWPRQNSFIPVDLAGNATTIISLDVYAGELSLDTTDVKVTVTVNGKPVTPYNVAATLGAGMRQWLTFSVDHNIGYDYIYQNGFALLLNDYVFTVKVENLRMSRTSPFLTAAQLAQIDPRAFQNHTLTWSYTVYDPFIVKPASYTNHSNITGLSTRANIGNGDNVLIAGIVVSGTDPLKVAFRAQGPSLAQAGIQHPATNPKLDIYQSIAGGSTLLGSNNGWKNGVNWRLVQSYSLAPANDLESVAVATLAPGLYTAVVSDTGAGGVGIVEAYAIDSQSASQLTAVSTRGIVGTGENVLIAGLITQQPQTVIVRTQGPALAALGVAGTVYSTRLSIYRQSDGKLLYQNSGWDAPGNERFHTDLASWVAGLSPTREAALVLTLPAGAYTAIVETPNGTPGVGIVEIYQIN
jgi:hypothetical protein